MLSAVLSAGLSRCELGGMRMLPRSGALLSSAAIQECRGALQALKHFAEALRLDPDHTASRKMRVKLKEIEVPSGDASPVSRKPPRLGRIEFCVSEAD